MRTSWKEKSRMRQMKMGESSVVILVRLGGAGG